MARHAIVLTALAAAVLLALGAVHSAVAQGTDWPQYRHDARQTGVSPGKGRIESPQVKWEYYLGTPFLSTATDRQATPGDRADLDGDGRLERFAIHDRTIRVTDMAGGELWSHTVDGRPLGAIVRVCRLFPDRDGLQIICFSSRMDTGEGQGYCFTFHRGARNGELAWTTGPLEGQHAPTLIVDDIDADGLVEVLVVPYDGVLTVVG